MSHQPIPPSLFDDDSDSEIDSDVEVDDSQDEFELDEVEGFKKVLNGKDGEDDEEMDDEDDDDDDEIDGDEEEEDSDFSEDEVEETNVLCALTGGKVSYLQHKGLSRPS